MLNTSKLVLLSGLSLMPGPLGEKAETRRLRRLKSTRGPASLRHFNTRLAKLNEGSIAIDLGANQGIYTEMLADTGAHVYAFEPEPWSFKQLKKRLKGRNNVTLINAAAMLEDGRVKMRRNPGFDENPCAESLGTSVVEWTPALEAGSFFDAECIDLMRFLRGLGRPVDLLKMDIEGGEVPLLEALLQSSEAKLIRHAFVETHEVNMPALRAPLQRLRTQIAAQSSLKFDLDWP